MKLPIPGAHLLRPGVSLELFVEVRPKPKHKFCVFCCVEDPPLYLLINSGINDYIRDRKHLLEQQIQIPNTELDERLYKNSYLDCSQAFDNFTRAEVCDAIDSNPACYMGRLSDELLARIVAVAKESVTLRPLEVLAIVSALDPKNSD